MEISKSEKLKILKEKLMIDYRNRHDQTLIKVIENTNLPDDLKNALIILNNSRQQEYNNIVQTNFDLLDLLSIYEKELEDTKVELEKQTKRSIFNIGGLWMLVAIFILGFVCLFVMYNINPDAVIKLMVLSINLVSNLSSHL